MGRHRHHKDHHDHHHCHHRDHNCCKRFDRLDHACGSGSHGHEQGRHGKYAIGFSNILPNCVAFGLANVPSVAYDRNIATNTLNAGGQRYQ
jgi:hypothetical protein